MGSKSLEYFGLRGLEDLPAADELRRIQVELPPVPVSFCCPRFVFSELFKHKERILAATDLSEDELLDTLNSLFAHIQFVDESAIPIGDWLEARRLCSNIDEKDTPFIALAIHLNARLWTEDGELKSGLGEKKSIYSSSHNFPSRNRFDSSRLILHSAFVEPS